MLWNEFRYQWLPQSSDHINQGFAIDQLAFDQASQIMLIWGLWILGTIHSSLYQDERRKIIYNMLKKSYIHICLCVLVLYQSACFLHTNVYRCACVCECVWTPYQWDNIKAQWMWYNFSAYKNNIDRRLAMMFVLK